MTRPFERREWRKIWISDYATYRSTKHNRPKVSRKRRRQMWRDEWKERGR